MRDLEIVSGTPLFAETRGPVQNLIDYLAGGDSLDVFLNGFPSVTREQAVGAIELMRASVLESTA